MTNSGLKVLGILVSLFAINGVFKSIQADDLFRAIIYLLGLSFFLVGIYQRFKNQVAISEK